MEWSTLHFISTFVRNRNIYFAFSFESECLTLKRYDCSRSVWNTWLYAHESNAWIPNQPQTHFSIWKWRRETYDFSIERLVRFCCFNALSHGSTSNVYVCAPAHISGKWESKIREKSQFGWINIWRTHIAHNIISPKTQPFRNRSLSRNLLFSHFYSQQSAIMINDDGITYERIIANCIDIQVHLFETIRW